MYRKCSEKPGRKSLSLQSILSQTQTWAWNDWTCGSQSKHRSRAQGLPTPFLSGLWNGCQKSRQQKIWEFAYIYLKIQKQNEGDTILWKLPMHRFAMGMNNFIITVQIQTLRSILPHCFWALWSDSLPTHLPLTHVPGFKSREEAQALVSEEKAVVSPSTKAPGSRGRQVRVAEANLYLLSHS